jgi:hypothetical protein
MPPRLAGTVRHCELPALWLPRRSHVVHRRHVILLWLSVHGVGLLEQHKLIGPTTRVGSALPPAHRRADLGGVQMPVLSAMQVSA